ncbi:MAG: PD-(D/E)XK nuclease family protein [Capsulimonas sp.]|uniref:RecB family exonuclease n=1 Tax=Capsulimonas sp. TaxID=2494211 RepID=UPI003264A437
MQVSYNKLKTFGECPLKYRLTYVERLPRPPIAWLGFQRRVHLALARYHDIAKRDGSVRIEELLSAYEKVWELDKYPELRDGTEYQDGEEILRMYCDNEQRKRRVPAHLEKKVRCSFGPYTLTGKVDRIDFGEDDRYSVVDYKLDRKLPPANPAAVDRQLSFYQLLVREGLGLTVDDVRLYYLRHGVEKAAPRTREHLHETVAWVDETAGAIQKERRWMPCEGDACKTCPYFKLCPAKTGHAREAREVWAQAELPW